jgi:UPF0755 protein
VSVLIPAGFSVAQIARRLAAANVCSEADFLAAVNTYAFSETSLGQIPYDPSKICFRLEGYLYPDTYTFYVNMPPQDAIGKMLKNADTNIGNNYSYSDMTTFQIVTLASIIQKEAPDIATMKNVSSVFHNRLNNTKKFPYLGSDATVFYLTKNISLIDTDMGSHLVDKYKAYYNTDNRIKGLPVGPICSPGAEALDAAANPADTPYLNFSSDATGYHFS